MVKVLVNVLTSIYGEFTPYLK